MMTKFMVMAMLLAILLAGCGSTNNASSASQATAPTAKGLALKLNFNSQKTAAKTVYGGGGGGGMIDQTPGSVRDRSAEIQQRINRLVVWVFTENNNFITSYDLAMSNGVITDGSLPLNVGKYRLTTGAYMDNILLYTGSASAEVFADGNGEATIDFMPQFVQYVNVRINKIPGDWFVSASNNPNTPYYFVETAATQASDPESRFSDYDEHAIVVYDGDPQNPNVGKQLLYSTPIYFNNPDNLSFDPTVSIFFKTTDNDGIVRYGEYQVDIIKMLDAIHQDGELRLDYPAQGTLNLSTAL